MSTEDCTNPRVSGDALRVRDAMVASPKTMAADGTVGDLRGMFANPHVAMALLVDGAAFAGVLRRDALPADVPDDRPARGLARRDVPTIEPDAPLEDARRILDESDERRLVVLDPDGSTLRGLLCLTPDRGAFCNS